MTQACGFGGSGSSYLTNLIAAAAAKMSHSYAVNSGGRYGHHGGVPHQGYPNYAYNGHEMTEYNNGYGR